MELAAYFAKHWWATFSVAALASVLALIVGLLAAYASVFSRLLARVLGYAAATTQSFPLQAIAPVLLTVIGTGNATKLLICFLIALFPIFGALQGALASSHKSLTPFFSITGSTNVVHKAELVFRAALPAILGAAKVGFTLAVLGAVVAEFILPKEGLGYVIVLHLSQLNMDYVLWAVLALIAQGLVVFGLLSEIERRTLVHRGEIT